MAITCEKGTEHSTQLDRRSGARRGAGVRLALTAAGWARRWLPRPPPVIGAGALIAAAFVGGLAGPARAVEHTWIYSVQLSAAVQAEPARVSLTWVADSDPANSFTVYRKALTDRAWGSGVTLGGDATSYTDNNVVSGATYEYKVEKRADKFTGYGYIAVGINAPPIENRGKVILIVDSSVAAGVAAELTRLQQDLIGDGWIVARHDVARDAAPADVKAQITTEYALDPAHTTAVFLIGHVPVVRSGMLNPDGHLARPLPADVYYGDMDDDWPDANGDGIYDPSLLPSDVELEVGRVDFADLPGTYSPVAYPNEVELLRGYLNKDHAYRTGAQRPGPRALIGNAAGDAGGQAYAASGYRNFAALVGAQNITAANTDATASDSERWTARLAANDYLWVYGCGAGSTFTIGSLGTHGDYHDAWGSDFVAQNLKGTFYLLFGSWFVDWAQPDNVMRSTLAGPNYGLAAAWSGRPHLYFHHMGIGETIGYGIRVSQNNDGVLYQNQANRAVRGIHIALMGDPTLRLQPPAPADSVSVMARGADTVVAWKPSPDPVVGYYVYRAAAADGAFRRLNDAPLSEPQYVDAGMAAAPATYMVRAIALQTTPSGTYYNPSQGAFGTNEAVAPAAEE